MYETWSVKIFIYLNFSLYTLIDMFQSCCPGSYFVTISALKDDLYEDVGVILAMAIIHGGQFPQFLSKTSYDTIARGVKSCFPTIEDISDLELRHKMAMVFFFTNYQFHSEP